MSKTLRDALLVGVLFLALWLPRTLALDSYVSADERKWLTRSANFERALLHGDWAATFQREHPAVTNLWAGTLGVLQLLPDYAQTSPGYFNADGLDFEQWVSASSAVTPLELLAVARWWNVLLVSLVLAVGRVARSGRNPVRRPGAVDGSDGPPSPTGWAGGGADLRRLCVLYRLALRRAPHGRSRGRRHRDGAGLADQDARRFSGANRVDSDLARMVARPGGYRAG
jgi:hypothetical protein